MSRKPPLDVSVVQANVLALFRKHGMMDDYELIDRYRDEYLADVAESTPRTRRCELADQGLVVFAGITRVNQRGYAVRVWKAA